MMMTMVLLVLMIMMMMMIIIIIISDQLECEVILRYLVGLTAVVVPLQRIIKASV
jgi:hypothetical protein